MLLAVLLPFLFAAPAFAEHFVAPLTDTQWHVVETPLECSLTQAIPGFGEAGFHQHNGEQLSLTFTTLNLAAAQSNVQFEIAAAPWQNSEDRQFLVSLPTRDGQRSFTIDGALARQALTQLEQGRFPAVRYRPQAASEDISALLSTVKLGDTLPAFLHCLDNLHADTFDAVNRLTVYFDVEQTALDSSDKQALVRVAEYVKVDDSITQVQIAGHTDNHGRRRLNAQLSDARADAVKQFLLQQGVDESLLNTSSHLEFKPAASNETIKGRALNRRVEVRLLR